MLPQMIRSLVLSLALTLLLELATAAIIGLRKSRDLLLIALVNILTNPIIVLTMNLTYFITLSPPVWYLTAGLELAAFLTEGLLYRNRLTWNHWNPFLLSFVLNATSYLGGFMLS